MENKLLKPKSSYDPSLQKYFQMKAKEWLEYPKIPHERQSELIEYKRNVSNASMNISYPFKGVTLTTDDLEWLIAVQLSEDKSGEQPFGTMSGLDLRGAKIEADLGSLPLMKMQGGVNIFDIPENVPDREDEEQKQRESAVVSFKRSGLQHARLDDSILCGADLRGKDLRQAQLQKADLSWAHLEEADLNGANLQGAILKHTFLQHARLIKADLEGAQFQNAQLEKADLRGAHLEGADFTGAHLEGAKFNGAFFQGAILTGAHLEGTNLQGSHLAGQITNESGKKNTGKYLQIVNLQEVFFDTRTDFTGAILIDERNSFPLLASVQWNDANFTQWIKAIHGRRLKKIMVGEEVEAKQSASNAEKQSDYYYKAAQANRQLSIFIP